MHYSRLLLSLALPLAVRGLAAPMDADSLQRAARRNPNYIVRQRNMLKPLIVFQAAQAALWLPWPEGSKWRDKLAARSDSIMRMSLFESNEEQFGYECDWLLVFDRLSEAPPLEPDAAPLANTYAAYARLLRLSSPSSRETLARVLTEVCEQKPEGLLELATAVAKEVALDPDR